MTASSVELFSSCRVQLIGLPQSAASNGSDGGSSSIRRSAVPSTMLPPYRRVSRNLFGSPQPGEVRELLHKETLQIRSYISKRYNIDISSPETSERINKNEPVHHHHPLPSLIAKEMLIHEKRLLQQEANEEAGGEECNLSRTPNSELPSTLISYISSSSSLKKSGQVRRTVAAPAVITSAAVDEIVDKSAPVLATQNVASDRLKPYTRQTLITDCYSLRKMPHTNVNNNRTAISMIATSQQQQLNVFLLPKPVNSVLSSTSIPIPSSATNRDSVQADHTISLITEATNEQQEHQQQSPQLV